MISNVVRAYGWLEILGHDGLIKLVLVKLGVIDFPLRIINTFQAVVIGLLTILLPYMIISIANSLTAIDRSLHEAAESLGANPLRTFWHVTWPLSSPGVASGLMLVFFLTLSAYVTIALLGGVRYRAAGERGVRRGEHAAVAAGCGAVVYSACARFDRRCADSACAAPASGTGARLMKSSAISC